MILYYTHNAKPQGFMRRCYDIHRRQAASVDHTFRAVVRECFEPDDIVMQSDASLPRFADIYVRILKGLEGVKDGESVYLCEDDTLYPDCRYAQYLTDGVVVYNLNLCYIGAKGYTRYMDGGIALSQMHGTARTVRDHIQWKLDETLRGEMACIEPCSAPGKPYISGTCRLPFAAVDFRTGHNASWNLPEGIEYFQELDGWPMADRLWNEIYKGGL
jgi:hypothetical protein